MISLSKISLEDFANMVQSISNKIGFKVSSRGWCFKEDALVNLDGGLRNIGGLSINDAVLSYSNKCEHQMIEQLHKRDFNGEMIVLKACGLLPIMMTPEHPVAIRITTKVGKRGQCEISKVNWTPAKDIKHGVIGHSHARQNICYLIDREEKDDFELNDDICTLLGYYLAEGSIFYSPRKNRTPRGIEFGLHSKEDDIANEISNIIKKVFKANTTIINRKGTQQKRVLVYSAEVARLMLKLGGKCAWQKKMCREVMKLPPKKQMLIFKAAQKGDGWLQGKKEFFCTTSKEMALQFQQVLFRNDIVAPLCQGVNGKMAKRPLFILHHHKKEDRHIGRIEQDLFITPISEVKRESFSGPVFNIGVSHNQNYAVQYILVHNCYQLETQGMITKAEFDKVENLINKCRERGILPIDFTAEEEGRKFSGVEEPTSEDPIEHMKSWIEAAMQSERYYCLAKDCFIMTDRGILRASEVSLRDKVFDQFGKLQKILKIEESKPDLIYEIKVEGGLPVRVTQNHPFLTIEALCPKHGMIGELRKVSGKCDYCRFKKNPKLRYVWKFAKDIKEGTRVLFAPPHFQVINNHPIIRNEHEAWLFGLYMGDGSKYGKNGLKIMINQNDRATIEKLEMTLKSLKLKYTLFKGPTLRKTHVVIIAFIVSKLRRWIDTLHIGKWKQIPIELLSIKRPLLACILKGLTDSDGWKYQRKGTNYIENTSGSIAQFAALALWKLDETPHMRFRLMNTPYGKTSLFELNWKPNSQSRHSLSCGRGRILRVRYIKKNGIESAINIIPVGHTLSLPFVVTHNTPDWWDGEEYYIQMLVEKIDLKTLFEPVCRKYHIPVATARGWSSMLQRAEYARRFKEAVDKGLRPVLLYAGDFDPDGVRISVFIKKNLDDLKNIVWEDGEEGYDPSGLLIERFGLNYDFIERHHLSWIPNLIIGSGGELARVVDGHIVAGLTKQGRPHKNFKMPYVQNYLKKYGVRKCEANAIVPMPKEAKALVEGAIIEYLGKDASIRFAEKRQAVNDIVNKFRDETGMTAALQKALDLINKRK